MLSVSNTLKLDKVLKLAIGFATGSRSDGSNASEGTCHETAQEESGKMYNLYRMDVRKGYPIFITPKMNGMETQMEVDLGAVLTVMGLFYFESKFPNVEIE